MTVPSDGRSELGPNDARIPALDVARGVAIFGILVVNVQTFGGPYPLFHGEPWTDPASQAVYALTDFAFVSKFFPLFSLLFGIGLSLQMDRVAAREGRVGPFVRRRLGGLFLIGLVHLAFLSTIDILVPYALLGFVLLAFRRASTRALLVVAASCLAVPVALTVVAAALHLFEHWYSGVLDASGLIRAYGSGTLAEVWATRLVEIRDYYVWVAAYCGWGILAMLALGAWAVRRGFVRDIAGHRAALARLCRSAFAIGIPAAAVHAVVWLTMRRMEPAPSWGYVVQSVAGALGEPAMAVGYTTAIALACEHLDWAERLRPLADVGRTALSNYVLQSAVMGAVFYSWGLGQYGRHGPVAGVVFVVAVYAVQVALSVLWLRHFRYGPLEAAWRAMTYGRWPRMRRGA